MFTNLRLWLSEGVIYIFLIQLRRLHWGENLEIQDERDNESSSRLLGPKRV